MSENRTLLGYRKTFQCKAKYIVGNLFQNYQHLYIVVKAQISFQPSCEERKMPLNPGFQRHPHTSVSVTRGYTIREIQNSKNDDV
jgi:hypothetical protein